VAGALRRWDLEALVVDAQLLTSELVTNSLVHARTDVGITVAVAEGVAEVGVTDRSRRLPEPRSAQRVDEGGRGLRLVELVAQDWGVVQLPEGKQVWFQLEVGGDWPHLTDCPCNGENLDRVRLGNGRYAFATPGPWDEA